MKFMMEESKQEKLPIDFITQFVSKGWEEVGNLKASCDAIKKEFSGTKNIEAILNNLIDAYLIAIGQMESHLDKKDYLDMPEETELKEALIESNEEEAQPVKAAKFEDEKCVDGKCCKKTEIFTELPDYDVEVEQKGDKVEIEFEPKEKVVKYIGSGEMVGGDFDEDEWPEPDLSDTSDIEAARASLNAGSVATENKQPVASTQMPVEDFSEEDWFMDFDDPDPRQPKLTDADIYD